MAKAKDFDTSPEAEAVLESLIEHELETQRHIDEVLDSLGPTKAKLKRLSRKLYNARANGTMTRGEAKRAWRDGFTLLALYEYASDVGALMGVVDTQLEAQYRAVKAFAKTGKSLTALRPIRSIEIKARATAKAKAKDDAAAGVREVRKAGDGAEAIHFKGPEALPKLKGPGSGRLPDMDKLKDKTPEQLVSTLERFGLEPDVKAISRAATRAYEARLERVIEAKAVPDPSTWEVLDGELERAINTVLRNQTKTAIRQHRLARIADVAEFYIYVAVGDGSCPSCEQRHGDRGTMDQWEEWGMPGSEVLICARACRCQLVPDLIPD
jgi:hypothetical protein